MAGSVLVLGAGMVGTSTALALQARGWDVTLTDLREPGQETSHGNAGIIEAEAAEPFAMPRDPANLWAITTGRSNDVTWDLAGLARQAPSLWRYFRASAPARHRSLARHYAPLTRRATADHAPLIEAAGADHLIRRDGFYMVLRSTAALEQMATHADRMSREYGVTSTLFDGAFLRRAEPVSDKAAGAVLWSDAWSCRDPGALVAAYGALFEARGGQVIRADAAGLTRKGAGWALGPHEAEQVVVALGPWTTSVLKPLIGLSLPMVLKRGYHCHMQDARAPSRPMLDPANGIMLAPMTQGLRVLSGADLSARAATTPRQLTRGEATVRDLVDIGTRSQAPIWSGRRPCMADMLPVLGPVAGQTGLWIHTGHGHQGFTLGPTTAAIVAEAMTGGAAVPAPLTLSRTRGHRWRQVH